MIIPDANLLIYAVDADSVHHAPARRWLTDVLAGTRPVGLTWETLMAFVRITTLPLFARPLTAGAALDVVDGWIRHPRTRLLTPTVGHWGTVNALLRAAGVAGKLTSDAHLAAIAIEHAATLASADNDFRRFPGLDYFNPLA